MTKPPSTSSRAPTTETRQDDSISADEFIFRATNHHVASCGSPPCIDESVGETKAFRSYFENQFGEQWILTYDGLAGVIRVYSGDCGSQTELTVTSFEDSLARLPAKFASMFAQLSTSDGQAPVVSGKNGPITLSLAEQQWIGACMTVIKARRAAAAILAKSN